MAVKLGLRRSVRDHAGQDQADGDRQDRDTDEDVLEQRDQRRLGLRDVTDGDQLPDRVAVSCRLQPAQASSRTVPECPSPAEQDLVVADVCGDHARAAG